MGLASFRHFCFICSLGNGCKFISGFTSGHAAGSLGKLSMINLLSHYNTATFKSYLTWSPAYVVKVDIDNFLMKNGWRGICSVKDIKPIIIICIIIDVLIVKSSLLLFLGVIKSKKWLLCQWIWVIIIGKALTDAAGLYLGINKLLQGYSSEGVSDIILSVGDAILYAYFALVVRALVKEIATEEAEKLLADEKH